MKASGDRRFLATLAALAAGQALVSLDASVLNVALPQVARTLDASAAQMQAIVVSYMIAAAAFTLPLAALGNRVGRGRVFLLGCALFTVGSLLCAVTPSAHALIIARGVQGLGAAGIAALALAILTESAPRERIPTMVGVWTSVSVGAAAAGPLVGGLLVTAAGWRAVFIINIPITLAVMAIARALLPRNDAVPGAPPVDWLAAALLSVSLGALAGGIAVSQSQTWSSPVVWGPLGLGCAAVLLLVWQQRRARVTLLDWRVLAGSPIPAALALFVLLGLVLSAAMYQESLFSQDVLLATPAIAGMLALGASVALVVLSPFTGRLSRRFPPAALTATGLLVAAASMAGLSRLGPGDSVVAVAAGLTVLGVGLGLAMPSVQAIAMACAPRAAGAEVSAGLNLASLVSSVLGISVLATVSATIAQAHWESSGGAPALAPDVAAGRFDGVAGAGGTTQAAAASFTAGVSAALLIAAVGLTLAAGVALATLPRRRLAEPGAAVLADEVVA